MIYVELHISVGGLSFCSTICRHPDVQRGQETHMPIRFVVANSENSYLATDAGILIDAFIRFFGQCAINQPTAVSTLSAATAE